MKTQVLPSKKRVDTVSVVADFSQMLQTGEEIVSGGVDVLVFTGTDPDPSSMLDGGTYIEGETLRHRIKLGNPGVVYQLIFSAVTDLDNIYEIELRQAVLLDNLPAGPLYQVYYFTTPPYSVISIDELGSTSNAVSGTLWNFPIDGIESLSGVVSGDLRDIVITYTCPPEGIDSTSGIVSGTLDDIVIFYYILPEGIDSTSTIVSGTLKDVVIYYSNYPAEGIDSTSNIVSGTLV